MVYLEINNSNYKNNKKDLLKELDHHLGMKDNKHFILFYMKDCGHCHTTRPEWKKLQNVLNKDFLHRKDIIIISIDHLLAENLKNIVSKPASFPTMRFITNSGKEVENYEDSEINNKDRSIDSFVEWIKLKSGENNISKSDVHDYRKHQVYKIRKHLGGTRRRQRKTRKITGGKWSLKYKRSIDCKNPKGFSQKQHCKYGRKK
jgi:thiol-disulfide isomerase/thioredoxin